MPSCVVVFSEMFIFRIVDLLVFSLFIVVIFLVSLYFQKCFFLYRGSCLLIVYVFVVCPMFSNTSLWSHRSLIFIIYFFFCCRVFYTFPFLSRRFFCYPSLLCLDVCMYISLTIRMFNIIAGQYFSITSH